jgi:hypothetical protein
MHAAEEKILAHAIQEIRQLLSPYLGSENKGPLEVRVAAHLAYALHNEAIALIEGSNFDVEAALKKVVSIDNILNVQDGSRLARLISESSSQPYHKIVSCDTPENENILHLKVVATPYNDPVEFNTAEARAFAKTILDAVERIERKWK